MLGHSTRILRNLRLTQLPKPAAIWELNRLRWLCRGRLGRNAAVVLASMLVPALFEFLLWAGDMRYQPFEWQEMRGLLAAVSMVVWLTVFVIWVVTVLSSLEQAMVLWRLRLHERRLLATGLPAWQARNTERRAGVYTGA